jgi:DNA-binding MarR family transcriptional regulator
MLRSLEARGLVGRERSPLDRRQLEARLTEKLRTTFDFATLYDPWHPDD